MGWLLHARRAQPDDMSINTRQRVCTQAPERDAESGQVAVVPVGPVSVVHAAHARKQHYHTPNPDVTRACPAVLQSKRAAFQAWAKHEAQIVWDMLRSSWLNLLLVLVPIALGVGFAHTNAVAVFVLVRSACQLQQHVQDMCGSNQGRMHLMRVPLTRCRTSLLWFHWRCCWVT